MPVMSGASLALVFDFLNNPADFMVGVGRVGCKNVRLTDEKLLLVGTERLPFLKLRSAVFGLSIRPRCELGIRRYHAEPFLVGEDRLAQLLPALIEQVHVADFLISLWRRADAVHVGHRAHNRKNGLSGAALFSPFK